LENHKVLEILPNEAGDTIVALTTSKGTIRAKKVVLTPGGWAGRVLSQLGLPRLPLQVTSGLS